MLLKWANRRISLVFDAVNIFHHTFFKGLLIPTEPLDMKNTSIIYQNLVNLCSIISWYKVISQVQINVQLLACELYNTNFWDKLFPEY